MFRIILFFCSIGIHASLSTCADTVIRRESASGPGKQFYTLVLKTGTETSAAVDFAKSTLKIDDLPPWVEIDNEFRSTTIEASPEQATELTTHRDIEHVVPVESTTHGQGVSKRNRIPKKRYYIHPMDGQNRTQFEATSLSLKALLSDEITEFKSGWMVRLSDKDKTRAESVEGVWAVVATKFYVKGAFAVEAIDRDDQERCKATGATLESLIGDQLMTVWTWDGKVKGWSVDDASYEQVSQIESIDSVLTTRPAHKGRRG